MPSRSTDGIRPIAADHTETHSRFSSIGRSEDGSGKVVPNLPSDRPRGPARLLQSHCVGSAQNEERLCEQSCSEPNGLRHREFILRSQATVKFLCWNALSNLLAVVLEEDDGLSHVQLWHRSNYYWYLKFEFQFASQVTCAKFHEEHPYRMFIVLAEEWREYAFCWDVSTYSATTEEFTAYVIDGTTLNSTPFHKALVPPPMYANSFTLEHCVRQIAFDGDRPVLYLSNGCLGIIDITNRSIPPSVFVWDDTQLCRCSSPSSPCGSQVKRFTLN
jgi:elongator complex protein 1